MPSLYPELDKDMSENEEAWTFYKDGTDSIEIQKDGLLQKIHFRCKDRVSTNSAMGKDRVNNATLWHENRLTLCARKWPMLMLQSGVDPCHEQQ